MAHKIYNNKKVHDPALPPCFSCHRGRCPGQCRPYTGIKVFKHKRCQTSDEPEGRVAEVAREHRWHPPKSLDSDENFKPKHTLFCCKLRFVAIYALFLEIFGQKKVPFWVKNSVSWARSALLHGIYCIFH